MTGVSWDLDAKLKGASVMYRVPGAAEPAIVHFLNPDRDGRFQSLHAGLRLNHRR